MSFGLPWSRSHNPMIDQVEELLRAGAWLGPAVLGALTFRVLAQPAATGGDELAGAIMLATAGFVLTVIGARLNGKLAFIGPLVFAAMFVASWSIR